MGISRLIRCYHVILNHPQAGQVEVGKVGNRENWVWM